VAVTHFHVDPSIAGDSGAGTLGAPYGDLQYCLNTATRAPSNTTQINVKAGTGEILAATLDFSTWGIPTNNAPTVIRGYTTAANDGGQGEIDGNDGDFLIATLPGYTHCFDLLLHNTGTAYVIRTAFACTVADCEIKNSTGGGVQCDIGAAGLFANNYIHDISAIGLYIKTTSQATAIGNYFANGAKDFSDAMVLDGRAAVAIRNIITIGGASNGIKFGYGGHMVQNSILSNSGSGKGIYESTTTAAAGVSIGNLVEGLTTGVGWTSSLGGFSLIMQNGSYNNGTHYSTVDSLLDEGDNEELAASPFDKSGSDTFANRFTYFAPVDTGNVHGGGYPSGCRIDKGAVQHADPAGGGLSLVNARRNSMIGR
jgi:hypothetical protein